MKLKSLTTSRVLKSFLIGFFLFLHPIQGQAVVTTPNIGLKLPDLGVRLPLSDPNNYGVLMNANLSLLDTQFGSSIPDLLGANIWIGAQTFNSGTVFSDGTVTTPGLTFSGDLDTGLYHTTDSLHFSTAGVNRLTIDAQGSLLQTDGFTDLARNSGLVAVRITQSGSGDAMAILGGSVGIGTGLADPASLLDLKSTTKGLLIPRMTAVQRDAVTAPPDGLLVYNTTTSVVDYFDGTAWTSLSTSGADVTLSNLGVTALNADIIPAVDNLRNLGSATKGFSKVFTNQVTSPAGAGLVLDSADNTLVINDTTINLSSQDTAFTLNNTIGAVNFDSNTWVIDALNNRVGIGVTAPANRIDVDGGIHFSGTLPGSTTNALYQTAGVLKWNGTDVSPFIALPSVGTTTGVPYDTSTAVFTDSVSVAPQGGTPQDISFNNDGTKLYVVGISPSSLHEYNLSPVYDTSTRVFVDSVSLAPQESVPTGMAFNNDGTKLYVVGVSNDRVNEYNLSPAYDTSTATFVDFFSVSAQSSSPQSISFNNDGSALYLLAAGADRVYEYALSSLYDVSTGVLVDSLSTLAQEPTPQGMTFNSDGTRLYVLGNSANIFEYSLSPAYDVSTGSFVDSVSVSANGLSPTGISFDNNGTNVYVLSQIDASVQEYAIATIATSADIIHPTILTSLVGVGTNSPTEKLHVVGNVKIVDGNQALNKILTSDANGVGTWQAASVSGLTNIVEDLTPQLGGNLDVNGSNITSSTGLDITIGTAAGNDFTVDTSKLVVEGDTGNVGIGTTTPLNYTGVGGLEISATDPVLRITDSNGVADKSNYELRAIGAAGFEGLQFRTVNAANTVFTDLLFMAQSGSIGIGTTAPRTTLQISNTFPRLGFEEIDASVDNKHWEFNTQGGQFRARVINDANTASSDWMLVERTGATVDSVSFPVGNIGIGTSTPGTIFEVLSSGVENAQFSKTSGDTRIRLGRSGFGVNANGLMGWDDTLKQLQFYISGVSAGSSLNIASSGNVGIGDSTPEVKLDVELGTFTVADSANVASATATALSVGNLFHITGTTTITSLTTCDAGNNGRLVTLIFNGILTFTDGSNLKLAGNFGTTADDSIHLACDGVNWYELSRSVN